MELGLYTLGAGGAVRLTTSPAGWLKQELPSSEQLWMPASKKLVLDTRLRLGMFFLMPDGHVSLGEGGR